MKNFFESLLFTIITLSGSFIPIIFMYLKYHFYENELQQNFDVFGNGEISIICVPLYISAVYSLYNMKSVKGSLSLNSIVFWITILTILLATWFYSNHSSGNKSNSDKIFWLSIFMVSWSFISLLVSKISENSSLDVQENRKENINNLEDKFDKL